VVNRPVSERVARWLSSLSAKYIAVFALLVAVPVIGTSVYLLYSSYEDNKRALTRLQQEKSTHWWGAVDAAIDEYIAMHRTTPGFRTLHFGDVVDVHLLDDERDNNAVIAARIAALLHERYELTGERIEFALGIAVEAADALIKMAFRRAPNGDLAVLDEARSLIKEYLHKHVN